MGVERSDRESAVSTALVNEWVWLKTGTVVRAHGGRVKRGERWRERERERERR
jgi:hypothetical protein